MNRILTFLVVLFLIIATSASFADDFSSISRHILYKDHGEEVLIVGRWAAVADTGNIIPIPRTNSVNVVCDMKSMICTESIAMFYGSDEIDKKPYLEGDRILKVSHEYKIVQWTATAIFAKEETVIRETGLRISLPDERVERVCRENGTKVDEKDTPDIYRHWVLE